MSRGEITLTWLGPDGVAGALLPDGRPLHVAGAVPGDRIAYEVSRERGRRVEARLLDVVAPSTDRRAPPCPWDADCGGCDLSALNPEARTALLGRMLSHTFGLDHVDVTPSPRARGHRARIKLAIDGAEVGYRAARSHQIVPITRCLAARDEVGAALDRLRAWLADHPGHRLQQAELRSDGQRVVTALDGRVDRAELDALAALGDVAVGGRAVHGDARLWIDNGITRLRAGPRAFYQVNLEVNAALVRHVRATLAAVAPERVLDLYCGIGNLTSAVPEGVPVLAVERDGQAIDDLRATAEASGWSAVRALALPVERFDPSREPFDAAILDPPRAGCRDILRRILDNRPRRIVYVSCFAASASRDLDVTRGDYTITEVRGFDMFPDTHHVEAVITLDRR